MYHRYQGESDDEDQDDDDDEKDDDTNPDATTEDDHDDLESLDNCGSLSYSVESAFSAISHEPNTTRGDTLMRRLVVVDESRKRRLLTSSQDEDDNDTEDSTPTTSHRTTPAPDRREDTKTNEDEKIECCFYPFSTTLLMYVERMFPNLKRTDSSSSIFVGIDHNNSNNTHTEELRNILEELRNIPSTNRAGTWPDGTWFGPGVDNNTIKYPTRNEKNPISMLYFLVRWRKDRHPVSVAEIFQGQSTSELRHVWDGERERE